jgi:dihydroxyacetone kinase
MGKNSQPYCYTLYFANGLGIHNEPGVQRSRLESLEETIKQLLSRLLDENGSGRTFITFDANDDVALAINNLGGLSVLELHAILDETMEQLSRKYGIKPRRVLRGTMVSSINGSGFSITLLKLNDRMIPLLDRSTDAAGWVPPARLDNVNEYREIELPSPEAGTPLGRINSEQSPAQGSGKLANIL